MRTACLLTLTLLWMLIGASGVYGAPEADLWPRWQAHDPASEIKVDHVYWDLILQRYTDANHPSGINRFRYGDFSEKDRAALKEYLAKMQEIPVSSLNKAEQKAYWINLYNALTVNVVLEYYPVKSIRDIDLSPGIFSNGPWSARLLKIEGEDVSLDDIEHRILRPVWHDNRVHYALNCASLGCPNLQPQAFTAQNLEALLEKAAREFVNHPRGAAFARNRLQVSSIYFWFQADFGGSEKEVIHHLQRYLSPENLKKLKSVEKRITHQYDWNLNE